MNKVNGISIKNHEIEHDILGVTEDIRKAMFLGGGGGGGAVAGGVVAETDPVFTAWLATSPNISIFTNDAGYLAAETDPIYSAWDKSTGISITESQISDFGSYQTSDATLTSIAALGTAANKGIYTTAADTWAEFDLTAAGRALLDDATAAAQATTLGLGTTSDPTFSDLTLAGDGSNTVILNFNSLGYLQRDVNGMMLGDFASVDFFVDTNANSTNYFRVYVNDNYTRTAGNLAFQIEETKAVTMGGWLNLGTNTTATAAGQLGLGRLYLNSTAYLDGATAGVAALTGALTTTGTITTAGNIIASATTTTFLSDSADGSDNKVVSIAAGGAKGSGRGAQVDTVGNDYTANNRGILQLVAGAPGTTGTFDGFIKFMPNYVHKWSMDRSGHFVPVTASEVDIGSTTAEVANLFIGTGRVYFGAAQAGSIYHDGTDLVLSG